MAFGNRLKRTPLVKAPNLLRLLMFFICLPAALAWALKIPGVYRGGQEICTSSPPPREHGHWLKVPVFSAAPPLSPETTDLYLWTKKPFDPAKKTVLFVDGGPGATSHKSSLDLPDWNVVFFDQRGNSCSRPPTKTLFLDRRFYSSENTVRDMEEIRKFLGVEKISVYGVSYGTVPAHLYGHFFPERVQAVVLEGVIFRGGEPLIAPPRRLRTLQKFFDQLPDKMQTRILELSQRSDMAPNWFSNIGMMMLYLDDPLAAYRRFLEASVWEDSLIVPLAKSFEVTDPEETEYGFSHVQAAMLSCQELGLSLPGMSFYAVFAGRKLVPEKVNLSQKYYCESLGFHEDFTPALYQAAARPSVVPTTYIQGTMDGATAASEAVLHFHKATTGFAQLILVARGGHAPAHGPLASGYETGLPIQQRQALISAALAGEPVPEALLRELEVSTNLRWLRRVRAGLGGRP